MIELFTALFSTLLALGGSAGYALDQIAADSFRSRLYRVEQLEVRIDNSPNYQVVQGRIDRLRLASRGAWLTPEVRLEALEVETDPLNLDISRLFPAPKVAQASGSSTLVPPGLFRTPLQAGIRLVVTEVDLQQALESPRVQSLIREIAGRFIGNEAATMQIIPQVTFLGSDRFQLHLELASLVQADPSITTKSNIKINLESGITILEGSRFQLLAPVLEINGQPLPSSVVVAVSSSLLDSFDLKNLESRGIVLRLLQLKITQGQLHTAAFVAIN